MPRLQTAYVKASGDEEPTSLLVRKGCKVGELQQFLYIQTGDPTTRPGDFYALGVRLDARAPISTRDVYQFAWMDSGSAIPRGGGCAGIQVLPEYTDIIPNLFERATDIMRGFALIGANSVHCCVTMYRMLQRRMHVQCISINAYANFQTILRSR
jgi:hypothetical protein